MKEYTQCKHCDHFVEENTTESPKYLHLENGEQEFDHNAEPGETLDFVEWQKRHPDLFKIYPDNHIGPNSQFYSRRGKIDGLAYTASQDTSLQAMRFGVCEQLFDDYEFDFVIAATNGWGTFDVNEWCRVFFIENEKGSSSKAVFTVMFEPNSTQVKWMHWA